MNGRKEVETLLNEGVPYARELLGSHGEFVPFGAVMDGDGEIALVTTEGEDSDAKLHVESLVTSFRSGAGEGRVRATAIFVNVEIQPDGDAESSDAIQVALEHSDGYCADVLIPYEIDGDEVTFGELSASHRDGSVFPDAGGEDSPS